MKLTSILFITIIITCLFLPTTITFASPTPFPDTLFPSQHERIIVLDKHWINYNILADYDVKYSGFINNQELNQPAITLTAGTGFYIDLSHITKKENPLLWQQFPGNLLLTTIPFTIQIINRNTNTIIIEDYLYGITPCDWLRYYDQNKLNCASGSTCVISTSTTRSRCDCNPIFTPENQHFYIGPTCSEERVKLYQQTGTNEWSNALYYGINPFEHFFFFPQQFIRLVLDDPTRTTSQYFPLLDYSFTFHYDTLVSTSSREPTLLSFQVPNSAVPNTPIQLFGVVRIRMFSSSLNQIINYINLPQAQIANNFLYNVHHGYCQIHIHDARPTLNFPLGNGPGHCTTMTDPTCATLQSSGQVHTVATTGPDYQTFGVQFQSYPDTEDKPRYVIMPGDLPSRRYFAPWGSGTMLHTNGTWEAYTQPLYPLFPGTHHFYIFFELRPSCVYSFSQTVIEEVADCPTGLTIQPIRNYAPGFHTITFDLSNTPSSRQENGWAPRIYIGNTSMRMLEVFHENQLSSKYITFRRPPSFTPVTNTEYDIELWYRPDRDFFDAYLCKYTGKITFVDECTVDSITPLLPPPQILPLPTPVPMNVLTPLFFHIAGFTKPTFHPYLPSYTPPSIRCDGSSQQYIFQDLLPYQSNSSFIVGVNAFGEAMSLHGTTTSCQLWYHNDQCKTPIGQIQFIDQCPQIAILDVVDPTNSILKIFSQTQESLQFTFTETEFTITINSLIIPGTNFISTNSRLLTSTSVVFTFTKDSYLPLGVVNFTINYSIHAIGRISRECQMSFLSHIQFPEIIAPSLSLCRELVFSPMPNPTTLNLIQNGILITINNPRAEFITDLKYYYNLPTGPKLLLRPPQSTHPMNETSMNDSFRLAPVDYLSYDRNADFNFSIAYTIGGQITCTIPNELLKITYIQPQCESISILLPTSIPPQTTSLLLPFSTPFPYYNILQISNSTWEYSQPILTPTNRFNFRQTLQHNANYTIRFTYSFHCIYTTSFIAKLNGFDDTNQDDDDNDPITPPFSSHPHCQECNIDNTINCGDDGKCICNNDFGGINCQISNQCIETSIKQCGTNGFVTPKSSNQNQCESTCNCISPWQGGKCNVCPILCLNGGKPYTTCRCGCPGGYSGDQCQCQSSNGIITLHTTSSTFISHHEYTGDVNNDEYQIVQNAYQTLYNAIVNDLSKVVTIPISTVKLTLSQVPNMNWIDNDDESYDNLKYFTKFAFSFTFGCEGYSPSITSSDITTLWSELGTKIHNLPSIKQYFISPTKQDSNISVEVEDLTPIPESLPTAEEEYRNQSLLNQLSYTIAFLCFVCLFIPFHII